MIKVSVIIPVYNVYEYIQKCLDSILAQTLHEIEIICVDDYSTDNSKSVILDYIKKDSRIKLIEHETNKGVSQSRNDGIDSASSKYIAFIDADDYVSENYLEELYNLATEYNADIVFTNNIISVKEDKYHYPNFNRVEKWKKNEPLSGLSHFNIKSKDDPDNIECISINIWKLWNTDFLKKHNLKYIKSNIAEDCNLIYKALANCPIIAYNHNATYYYIQRDSSLISNLQNKSDIPYGILDVFKDIFLYYKENNQEFLIYSNYWNFRSLLYTYDNYKGSNKNEFYLKIHSMLAELNVNIENNDNMNFLSYQCNLMKTEKSYEIYSKKIEEKKRLVNMVAWFIPTFSLRVKFREYSLNYLSKNKEAR